jgi:hypothetical protein
LQNFCLKLWGKKLILEFHPKQRDLEPILRSWVTFNVERVGKSFFGEFLNPWVSSKNCVTWSQSFGHELQRRE